MTKRKDEEFCRNEFNRFLVQQADPKVIQWEDVPRDQEPPDYFLDFAGARFAAEVTTLVEDVQLDSGSCSILTVWASQTYFVEDMEETAKQRGILQGIYVVGFSGPLDNWAAIRPRLQKRLLNFIEDSRDSSTAPETWVLEAGSQYCSIQKLSNESSVIGWSGGSNAKWECEILAELQILLDKVLETKREKLRKVNHPIILLILDRYHLPMRSSWEACAQTANGLDAFHSVFVVREGNGCLFLHSENQDWLPNS